jgi:hypothetical protein
MGLKINNFSLRYGTLSPFSQARPENQAAGGVEIPRKIKEK